MTNICCPDNICYFLIYWFLLLKPHEREVITLPSNCQTSNRNWATCWSWSQWLNYVLDLNLRPYTLRASPFDHATIKTVYFTVDKLKLVIVEDNFLTLSCIKHKKLHSLIKNYINIINLENKKIISINLILP